MTFYYNNTVRFKKNQAILRITKQYDIFKLFWGELKSTEPTKAEIVSGVNFNDILYYESDPCNMAISERFKHLLITNKITGWNWYDLDIKDSQMEFSGFSVIGRCGELIRPLKKSKVHGFNFEINTWDGSDFFCPKGFGYLFFSSKVRDLVQANNIQGLELQDISSIDWYSSGGVYKKEKK